MSVFRKETSRNFHFGRNPIPGQTGIRGKLVTIGEPQQQNKFNRDPAAPRVPDYWDEAKTNPKKMVLLELQTTLQEDGDDDGMRKLFVTIDKKPGSMLTAIQSAVEAAGREDLEPGGELALWFVNFDPDSQVPENPRKIFGATWAPPASGGGAFQQQQQQQQQYQQQQQQQQQYQHGWAGTAQQEGFNTGGAVNQPGPQQVVNQGPPQQVQGNQRPPVVNPEPPQGGVDFGAMLREQHLNGQQQAAFGGEPVDTGTGEIGGGAFQQQQQQQQQQQWPAPQPAAAPPAAGPQEKQLDTNAILELLKRGATEQEIVQATGATPDAIRMVRQLTGMNG